MIDMKRILLPTDFSEPSAIAGKYAKAMAENFHASLHVLHVIEESALVYPLVGYEGTFPPLPQLREDVEKEVRSRLQKLLSSDEQQALRAQLAVRTGSPFVEIVRYAKEQA